MNQPRRSRRLALAVIAALGGALLPMAVATVPAHAADACLSEAATGGFLGFGGTRCDDISQPVTTLTGQDPTPNPAGYLNVNHISFTFSGAYTDADADPITFQCQFYSTVGAPSDWKTCTSPATYSDLTDTGSTPYTFRVRAVDSADNDIDATASPGVGGSGASSDVPDYDESPESYSFRVDTKLPDSYILGTPPYDADNPDMPMIFTDSPEFKIAATEPASFVCTINDEKYPCSEGLNTFENLTTGDKTLSVTATDAAGNVDPSPATTSFAVPDNLALKKPKKAWTRFTSSQFIGGDILETRKQGATISYRPPRQWQELRIIASAGPGYGKIQVELASKAKYIVNLNQKKRVRQKSFVVLSRFSRLRAARKVTITVLSSNKTVRLDGILMH